MYCVYSNIVYKTLILYIVYTPVIERKRERERGRRERKRTRKHIYVMNTINVMNIINDVTNVICT